MWHGCALSCPEVSRAGCVLAQGISQVLRFKDPGMQWISKMIHAELICLLVSIQVMVLVTSNKHFHLREDAFYI